MTLTGIFACRWPGSRKGHIDSCPEARYNEILLGVHRSTAHGRSGQTAWRLRRISLAGPGFSRCGINGRGNTLPGRENGKPKTENLKRDGRGGLHGGLCPGVYCGLSEMDQSKATPILKWMATNRSVQESARKLNKWGRGKNRIAITTGYAIWHSRSNGFGTRIFLLESLFFRANVHSIELHRPGGMPGP